VAEDIVDNRLMEAVDFDFGKFGCVSVVLRRVGQDSLSFAEGSWPRDFLIGGELSSATVDCIQ